MLRHCFVNLPTGIRMHYVEAVPAGQTIQGHVVLVHGFPDSWYGWRHQIKPIRDAGFHVIAPDNRGYGETTPYLRDRESYTMEQLCKDYEALLDALLIDEAVFVGHDWGGTLVWNMSLHYKDRVKGVAGLCTPFFPANPKSNPWKKMQAKPGRFDYQIYFQSDAAEEELDADVERTVLCTLRGASPEDMTDLFNPDMHVAADVPRPTELGGYLKVYQSNVKRSAILTKKDADYYVWQFEQSGYIGALSWYRNVEENWEWNNSTAGQKIVQPALMVTAENDAVLKPSMCKHMPSWIDNLAMHNVPNAGHFVAQEQPRLVNDILVEWLRSTFGSGSGSGSGSESGTGNNARL